MRELVLKMSLSLDGLVAGDRAESDWMFRATTPDSGAWLIGTLAGAGTHISGRRLFETWAGLWPVSPSPVAAPMNAHPKVVFTRQAGYRPADHVAADAPADLAASWAGTRVAGGDLATEVEQLKQEPGDYILAQGGVEFARSLLAANLVDELRLAVLPVALGSGEGLFAGLPNELDLTLVDSTRFAGGVMANTYRPVR
ncbi:dihydrofolate reductase family protein [Herbiconiux sp. YIM B11900]|uniref:dihydrofolate reductase family protein n=1 Tax=Herbiconiux sp. YIM B11900 TaxID=3404131 RepID=UPI003F83CBCC